VYVDYKLKLKAYSKKRFDPFCRWDRISIPFKDDKCIETTIGQLNFFKWALENKIIEYIDENYDVIESDMNNRNSTSKRKEIVDNSKTRKKREELSISATKSIKKEKVEIVVQFN
jgi:phage antirepressor YoqD-like protein